MARIDSRTLFLTTSPRTPEKMVPEIDLLIQHFDGQVWDHNTQTAFMDVLREANFYNGQGDNDPAFSARDRINRAPKALGFVCLSPKISLTPAGSALLSAKRKSEVFLRQLLKFQIPSPYHRPTEKAARFCVKPYLEILRLIRKFGSLNFDELQIFGMQLTDYHKFDDIVDKIENFRRAKAQNRGSYRQFKGTYLKQELLDIYSTNIERGETQTRESHDATTEKFLRTKAQNMRDYADSCFRYLRATELVNVSHTGKSLSIIPERIADVDYLLNKISREPRVFKTEADYIAYLGDAQKPALLTDNKAQLLQKIRVEFPSQAVDENQTSAYLKDLYADLIEERKQNALAAQVHDIKDYRLYDDIQNVFDQIEDNALYDAPLMLEWNTWRAMTMLDGGNIQANLHFDDFGKPLSTAGGNMPDIVCDYGDFVVAVEVTMGTSQRQFETESEPISRHLGKLKSKTGKHGYCLFVAPTISPSTVAFCYMLHKTNIDFYGGTSTIVPLPLNIFRKMVESSYKVDYTPNPEQVKRFFEQSNAIVEQSTSETEWHQKIVAAALDWL